MRAPKPLIIDSGRDMSSEWKLWRQQYELFQTAAQLTKEDDEIQIATFLSIIGFEALRIYNNFKKENGDTVKKILDKFDGHFVTKRNVTFERYKFHKISQMDGEKFDSLIERLRHQAQFCEFGDLEDSLIRDQLICSIESDDIRGKLLSEDTTLEKAMQFCKIFETTLSQVQEMAKTTEVSAIAREKKKPFDCKKCGTRHIFGNCSYYRHECKICKKKKSFRKVLSKRS